MDYKSQDDQDRHEDVSQLIKYERGKIARHYRNIRHLQNRLMGIGTEDEQLAKRLKLRTLLLTIDDIE